MQNPDVTIRLTPAEAVVLDDLLRRFSLTDRFDVETSVERQVLWNLLCLLERQGDRPVWPSLSEAQSELRASDEYSAGG